MSTDILSSKTMPTHPVIQYTKNSKSIVNTIQRMYVAIALGSTVNNYNNVGTVYNEFLRLLSTRSDWTIKSIKADRLAKTGRYHLVIGEPQGQNISFKFLTGYDSLYPGIKPLVNYYRNYQLLCRKSMMAKLLKEYLRSASHSEDSETEKGITSETEKGITFNSICPESYLFYPSKREDSEREEFLEAASESSNGNKIWILKPSDGCKGHNIQIMESKEEVLDFIDNQSEGSISWVVQRYLENPILIPTGKRKFDIRVWVVCDSEYRIHVYRQGVLRVTAKTYEPGNWTDLHSHLSNHCIAETHPGYGQYEPTNEIWFEEFETILSDMSGGSLSFSRDVIPKIHNIIRLTLMAVKEKWECSVDSGYRSFALFGYDFMLTESSSPPSYSLSDESARESRRESTQPITGVDVWLIEINSSPALAEKLLPVFVQELMTVAIDSIYEIEDDEYLNRVRERKSERERQVDEILFPEEFLTL